MDHSFVYSENMGNVEPYNCWDGVVNGDGVFEDILNILDFPMESLEGGDDGFIGDWDATTNSHPFDDTASHVLQPMPVSPIDATHELNHKLSYRAEDTSCLFRPNKCNKFQEQKDDFKTQSPAPVIESNGSSLSAGKIKRGRSTRARPSGLSPWLLMSPPFSAARKNSERRKILSQPCSEHKEPQNGASRQRPTVTKRCSHCQVTQTPQWRGGPMGPKTLCNACGVRYRSGRLLPEYRPAASPTFVSSLHSNSHKKVVEMRIKTRKQQVTRNEQPSMSPDQMEFVPMSSYLFDSIC